MATRITINKPMLEAIVKMLQMEYCPLCGVSLEVHAWVEIKGRDVSARVSACSNRPKG